MSVHEVASSGFGAEAEAYERSRPSYPPDALAWLANALNLVRGSTPGRLVLDLAAGTGKFTRLLVPWCRDADATLFAVEPVAGMYALLSSSLPSVPITAATAERLPFADESLDAIVVAQAFHWFDAATALPELHRALRPGGRVGLIWNARDRSVPWVDKVWQIMDRVEKRAPWRDHDMLGEWRETTFDDNPWFMPLFTPLVEATFHHEQLLTPEDVVDRIRSVSHVAVLPPDHQRAVLDEVRAVMRDDPAIADQDVVALPYRVDAYWAERR